MATPCSGKTHVQMRKPPARTHPSPLTCGHHRRPCPVGAGVRALIFRGKEGQGWRRAGTGGGSGREDPRREGGERAGAGGRGSRTEGRKAASERPAASTSKGRGREGSEQEKRARWSLK